MQQQPPPSWQDKTPSGWTIANLLDLEFFLGEDEGNLSSADEEQLYRRDRQIFLDLDEQLSNASGDDRGMLLAWLCARRELAGKDRELLPGHAWKEIYRAAAILVPLAGLFAGGGAAFGLLVYSGAKPVNVFVFLGLLVGVPLVFLLLQGALLTIRRFSGQQTDNSGLRRLLARRLLQLTFRVKTLARERLNGEQRQRLAAKNGRVLARTGLYRSVVSLPPFLLLQGLAAGFSAGAVASTLMKVIFTDVAFGWQSTLALSAEQVWQITSWLALPWSWCLPAALPTAAQVEGSHLVLKEGISQLATADLASWWPFLCMTLLVYGLVPRLLLLLIGNILLGRRLATLQPGGNAGQRLLARMRTAIITTADNGKPAPWQRGDQRQIEKAHHYQPSLTQPTGGHATFQVLVPEELSGQVHLPELAQGLPSLPLASADLCSFSGEPDTSIEELRTALTGPLAGLLIIQEAWQPPIGEQLFMIRELRQLLGAGVPVTVLLLGRPADTPLTTPSPEDVGIWEQRLTALGDPDLHVCGWAA
ncbi:MAG: hypothetical protein CSA21_04175 [Deltaproteobacteria bacterium]|nr:MAG: hypothetical protein CSA21_04175 [Deltaproteobacteria bacterium]